MKEKKGFDIPTIVVSMVLLGTMLTVTILKPVEATAFLVDAKNAACDIFGSYFMLMGIICLGACMWFAFSKYGEIRMGKEKPEYSTFSWGAMTFCAAMGSSVLYWAAVEWAYYIQSPPLNMEPFSREAIEHLLPYNMFHWGLVMWAIYAIGTAVLAYRYYVRGKAGLTLQDCCEGVLGDKAYGPLGTVINIIFVLAILGGLTISYGTGIPMLANNLANFTGINEGFLTNVLLTVAITIFFSVSTSRGLQKGMKVISGSTSWLCFIICGLFLFLGHTRFAIENTLQSTGILIDKFPLMLTGLDTVGESGFPQEWTVFFWAWSICLAPWMWVFIAKISRGRTMRALVLMVIAAGTGGSLLFFTTISNYGIKSYLEGTIDIISAMADKGVNQIISDLCLSLPLGVGVLIFWFVSGFLLLATTMDSASYTLAASTSKGLLVGEDPKKSLRLLWAVLLSIAPFSLLYAGQFIEGGVPLGGLQALLILCALPISITLIMTIISGVKWVTQDYAHLTREQIRSEFAFAEEAAGSKNPATAN